MNTISEILIFENLESGGGVEVVVKSESVWLSLSQLSKLFDKDKSVISRHLKNIFRQGELIKDSVVAKNATTANDGKIYLVDYYNLDAILSVGYRVNSKNATQFRIWANKVLKEYLIKGYAINEKAKNFQLENLSKMVQILNNSVEKKLLNHTETNNLIRVIADYAYSLEVLDNYDHQKLKVKDTSYIEVYKIDYDTAIKSIHFLKEKFGGSMLFGNQKDESFKSSLNTIYQTFDGEELYASVEEKAACIYI